MFHGGNNPLDGGYIFPPTPPPGYSFSPSPPTTMGYMGPPPPPYPNAPAVYSPVYYLPSLSPPFQQPINTATTVSPIDGNNGTENLPPQNFTRTSSPNSIPSIVGTSGSSTILPTNEKEFVNLKSKSKEDDKKGSLSIDESSSTLLLTDRFAVKLEPNKYIHGIPATKWYTLSDQEREEVLRNQRRVTSYKTALCVTYRLKGSCSFGENCRFAHSLGELKPPPVRHPKYKTQLCDKFSNTGICPYGSRCNFIHATKGGEIVSDYRKYLASKRTEIHNYEEDSDEENDSYFAVSMNSIPKRYNQVRKEDVKLNGCDKILEDCNKPQQVINFSKSFGAPVIRTLFEKGRLLKDNQNVNKKNNFVKENKLRDSYDNLESAVESLPKAPSPPYGNTIYEVDKKKKSDSGKSILDKLFTEYRKYEGNIKDSGKIISEEIDEIETENYFPGSRSYTSSHWKKHSSYTQNAGYYSRSKLPTFLKYNNS